MGVWEEEEWEVQMKSPKWPGMPALKYGLLSHMLSREPPGLEPYP